MRPSNRVLLAAVPMIASLAACATQPRTQRERAIYDARERAMTSTWARDAVDLAKAVHRSFELGDYASNYAQLSSDALAALSALERVVPDSPDLPTVVAWRGVMYEDTGRVIEAREQYKKSFEIKPTYLAGERLIAIYGMLHDSSAVIETCKATYATLSGADGRIALLDRCSKELVRLVPKGQTLAWLEPEVAAWYERERERRARAAASEQAARRERQERAAKVAAYVQRCSATCQDQGMTCQQRCTGDPACNDRCDATYNRCVDGCEAAAQKALTPAKTAPVPPPAGARRTDPSARAAAKA